MHYLLIKVISSTRARHSLLAAVVMLLQACATTDSASPKPAIEALVTAPGPELAAAVVPASAAAAAAGGTQAAVPR